MQIQRIISKLKNAKNLSTYETEFLFTQIFSGNLNEDDIEKILYFLSQKGETVDEITTASKIMKKFAIPVPFDMDVFDVCGTGGSGKAKTFNISTAVAFIMASGGVTIAKHGNRKASSQSGSADVLEYLNINISLDPQEIQENLKNKNMSFLFAQVLHPSMKYVMPVRKRLGIRTIFNFMGPLTNPSNPLKQLVGVSEKKFIIPMAQILQKLGKKSAMVVCGEDGLDEITLTGKTYFAYFSENSKTIETGEILPENFGFDTVDHSKISGGCPQKNAEIITKIFSGELLGHKKNIILLNAGAGFFVAGKTKSISDGISLAKDIIENGKALQKLKSFQII